MPAKRSQQNVGASRTSISPSNRKGILYVVAVSLGHPDDVTLRAVRTLRDVDLIASEDPKITQALLMYHGIQTTVTSYGPRNLKEKAAVLVQRLRQGIDVALVSDCGSPLVADPGSFLVAAAHAHDIPVVPIPGPSAIITALTAAGFSCDSFYFFGHLPSASARTIQSLIDSIKRRGPTVAFCTGTVVPHILKAISPRCSVAVAYDMTKPNERIIRGTVGEVLERLSPAGGGDVTIVFGEKTGTDSNAQGVRRSQSLSSRRINTR
ncbi:MAG: hypothetical protein A4E19_01685 [Nitrospira sp. SG-bin1]|nr:MAG: hypothetical protein A4E19_01685 [Nitrospira sp. SG-bin1]